MLELYTLNTTDFISTFERDVLIDAFVSVIWTERYIEAGDMKLVVPATRDNIKLLYPGCLLELNTSKEPMVVDTRSIEKGMLTVTGHTLEKLFNDLTNPYIQSYKLQSYEHSMENTTGGTEFNTFNNTNDNPQTRKRHKINGLPEVVLGLMVQKVQDKAYNNFGFVNPPFITVGSVDTPLFPTRPIIEQIVPEKDIYDELLKLAKTYKIGISVKLVRYPTGDKKLVFTVYPGVDLTSNGPDPTKMVRFSPELQNFANVKELQSRANFKNVAIIRPPTQLTWLKPWRLRMYSTKSVFYNLSKEFYLNVNYRASRPTDYAFQFNCEYGTQLPPANVISDQSTQVLKIFKYLPDSNASSKIKEIFLESNDITEDMLGDSSNTNLQKLEVLLNLLKKRAVSALNDNKQVNIIDGEVPSSSIYRYKTHYKLGDLVDMEGYYGNRVTGRVTEYIQSSDNTGEKAYPTIVAEDVEFEKVSPVGSVWLPDGI